MQSMLIKCFAILLLLVVAYPQVCPINQYYGTDNTCHLCTLADQSVCGVATSTCQFYYWNGANCVSCLPISNTDASVVSTDQSQCKCAVSYYWVATSNTCQSCSSVTTQTVCNSCSNVFLTSTSSCVACSTFTNAINKYDGNGGCLCVPGWTWSTTSQICVACGSADEAGCQVASCGGFFWSGSACTACSTVASVNSFVASPAGSCACMPGLSWTGSACTPCNSPTISSSQCQQLSCSSYVWNSVDNICADCTGITGATSATPVNGQCTCNSDSYWDTASSSCLSCSDASFSTCRQQCKGYIWAQNICQTCQSITYADTSFNIYAINGNCICQQNFIWDPTTLSCLACSSVTTASKCGTGTCINYYWTTKGGSTQSIVCSPCSAIANTMPRQSSDPSNICSCIPGSIWSSVISQCVACDLISGYTFNNATGKCQNCNINNAIGNYNFRDKDKDKDGKSQNQNLGCQCSKNYAYIGGACTCDRSQQNFDLGKGKGCGPCTSILGASTPTPPKGKSPVNTNGTCNCVNGSAWNNGTSQCICTSSANFMTATGCKSCSAVPQSTGTVDSTSPYQCGCNPGFFWDPLNNICACGDPYSIITSTGSCLSCLAAPGSNGKRVSSLACGCVVPYKWNSTQNKCICDSTIAIIINGVCKACSTIPGASTIASNGQCTCNTGRKWSSNSCVCTSPAKCPCGTGNYQLSSGACVACSSVAGATGLSTNTGQCTCLPGFIWQSTTGTCQCPSNFVTDGFNICVACNILNNATSLETSNTCYCLPNHIWNPATFNCDYTGIMPATQSYIQTFAGVLTNCNGLGGSTGLNADNFNCQCSAGSFWNDILAQCIECSSITFSTINNANAYSCICNPGYSWDIFTFTCILFTGTIDFSKTTAVTCRAIPSATSIALVDISKTPPKLIQLSDDGLFAYLNSANPLYKAELPTLICTCATGYLWNASRKRCYISTLNAAF